MQKNPEQLLYEDFGPQRLAPDPELTARVQAGEVPVKAVLLADRSPKLEPQLFEQLPAWFDPSAYERFRMAAATSSTSGPANSLSARQPDRAAR